MLGRLLSNGFDKETSIELINNTILSNNKNETYATLDTMILDLYSGNSEYIKNGAAPTFIKNKKNVDIIKSIALPTGILNNVDLVVFDRDLEDGDIIVMCTDGIVESNREYTNKEIWVKNILENIETAFKSAFYTHFRRLYNERERNEELRQIITPERASAIFYFIREKKYISYVSNLCPSPLKRNLNF